MKHRLPLLLRVIAAAVCLILAAGLVTGVIILLHSSGETGQFQYLVVLGTTVHGTEPSSMLRDRINAAAAYLQAHPDVICIVSGGKGDSVNLAEAQCMFNELTALGIGPERIWLEDRATSTQENLAFSMALIEEKNGSRPETVGILSSEFHLLRAKMFAKEQGVTAVTLPAKTTDLPTFLSYFLREIVMVWYYSTVG